MTKPGAPPSPTDYGDCTPAQTAQVLLTWCRAKTTHDLTALIVLGALAGAFIALGAVFFTAVMMGMPASNGPVRFIAGMAFAMGLLLVCMTGAELSTGNCMLAAAWSEDGISGPAILHVLWGSFLANVVGALAIALLIHAAGLLEGQHGITVAAVAKGKAALAPEHAFWRGVMCNALVCLAVWMILAARTLPSKLLGLTLPIAAFVACGFEHSIANVYFLQAGRMAGADITTAGMLSNLTFVTAGNLAGGVAVALALRHAHLRRKPSTGQSTQDEQFAVQRAPVTPRSINRWTP